MLPRCLLLACLLVAAGARADESSLHAPLPPTLPWSGESEQLVVAADDPWITPAERTGLTRTPDYAVTMEWLGRLVEAAPELSWTTLGTSAQGRAIRMIIADREGLSDPEAIRAAGRARVLAHAGIHAGEIDGKDAGMMLLRDMTVADRRAELLDKATFLFIPILSVDGHERSSAWNRMNQRGPTEMGWRTNARNLNLNRDFAKLETEGVRALVEVVNTWRPDLYLDLHVTDGVDYQYDITYGWNGQHAWSPAIAGWLDGSFRPAVDGALEAMGHIPGPLIFAVNGRDLSDGMVAWTAGPRYSTGWGDARHLPSVLLENHSLKPYRQRVLGTYVFLAAALERAGGDIGALRRAVRADRASHPDEIPLTWQPAEEPGEIEFKGVRSRLELSAISGTPVPRWTGEAVTETIPRVTIDRPGIVVERPAAYYIPAEWSDIARRLETQGLSVERLEATRTVEARRYRLPEAALDAGATPYEGRARYTSGEPQSETVSVTLPAGSWRVDTAQPMGTLAVLLLEPQSPDSYFQWGYMAHVLQRTEYYEAYAMEPLARRMLEENPEMRAAFRRKLLEDAEFAGDPRARMDWFYRRTPYYDAAYRVYPVLREGR